MNTFVGNPIMVSEERFKELTKKEEKLDYILDKYPELVTGQKLTPAAKRYKTAFEQFYEKVTQTLWSDEVRYVFTVAHLNGQEYKGRSLDDEIVKAKKILGKK